MSQEDKDRIHNQIDFKMDQLEKAGLSREEILFNRPGGLLLSQDPVFQFLRVNRSAREMIVKPGEEFTAYKVVDYALRQDIGVDRSNTIPDITPKFEHELSSEYHLDVADGQYPNKIKPEDYYWNENFKGKMKKLYEYAGSSPLVYPEKILTKGKYIRKHYRQIHFKDIHYKNTEFLSQFMTEGGKIKNRWQTRLSGWLQRKVAKAIKHAKCLNLFPSQGFILPPHKMNLVPLHTQGFHTYAIHAETGTVFPRKFEGELSRLNEVQHPNTVEKIANKFVIENNQENYEENMLRAKGLIDYDIQFLPTKKQLDIIEAHQYLVKGGEKGKETVEILKENSKSYFAADVGTNFIREKGADPDIVNFI